MKYFTTNMALRDSFYTKKFDKTKHKEPEVYSKEIRKKLQLIKKAFHWTRNKIRFLRINFDPFFFFIYYFLAKFGKSKNGRRKKFKWIKKTSFRK